jgi:hypothetical protein
MGDLCVVGLKNACWCSKTVGLGCRQLETGVKRVRRAENVCLWAKNRLKWTFSVIDGQMWAEVSGDGCNLSDTRVVGSGCVKTSENASKIG